MLKEDLKSDEQVDKKNINFNDLTFCGKKITDLTQEELYIAIQWLYNDNERYRKMYYSSQNDICDYMQMVIDTKKSQQFKIK